MNAARTAWLVVVLLMPVAALNYLDRQMLTTMQFSVAADIPPAKVDANWGLMLGQFKWVYAILSPVGGWIADRFSRRFTICGSLFVWSAVTWWTGQAVTFGDLMLARSLMGISEAFYFPAALALIADYHAGGTRSRAVGMHQMAVYLGVIVGGFGGYAADAPMIGWRGAFTACGVVGMIYAVPLVLLLRDLPRVEAEGLKSNPVRDAKELVTNPSFLLLVLYFTLPAMAGWVVRDWMPKVLKVRFDLTQGLAGFTATLSWQLAAIVGVIVGGWLSDRAVGRTARGRIFVSAIGTSLIIPALFGVGNAPTLGVAVAALVLFGFGWGFFDGNNMPILCQIVRPHLRATGYGIMNFVSVGCGGFADWGYGKLRTAKVEDNVSFALFAAVVVLSVGLVLLIRPKAEVRG